MVLCGSTYAWAIGGGMIFVCPNCSSKYRIPEERFTRDQMRVKCRSCGLISTVTRPAQAPEAHDARPASAASSQASGSGSGPDAARKKPRLFEHWYFLKGRERKGPYAFADLDKFAAAGTLTEATYVWHPTFDGWKKIRDVKILRPLLERTTQAPPPPPPGVTISPPRPTTSPAPAVQPQAPAPLAPSKVEGAQPADDKHLVAGLLQASSQGAAPVRKPIHRTENLVNLLDQIEQQQAAERAEKQREAAARQALKAEATPAAPAPTPGKEQEKRKIVELLERLDRAEKHGDEADIVEQSFFGDEATILDVHAARGEDLNDVLRQLAEEGGPAKAAAGAAPLQQIFDQGAIPEVAVPERATAVPAAMDRKKLVQEFSFMLRHERKNKRRAGLFIAAAILTLAGAAYGLTQLASYLAVRPIERQAIEARRGSGATYALDDPTKKRTKEQQIADELAARVAELRKKQTAEQEERRMAEEAARRVAMNSAQRIDRATGIVEDTPSIAKQFEFKVEEKASPSKAVAAGTTIKAAESGGKEEVVIGLKSQALKNAADKTFSEEEMTNIIRKKMKQFNICKRYSVGMDQVQVLLDFTVGTSGTVSRISLKSDQPLPAELATCIRGELQKWTFPPPDKPASFTRNLILD